MKNVIIITLQVTTKIMIIKLIIIQILEICYNSQDYICVSDRNGLISRHRPQFNTAQTGSTGTTKST